MRIGRRCATGAGHGTAPLGHRDQAVDLRIGPAFLDGPRYPADRLGMPPHHRLSWLTSAMPALLVCACAASVPAEAPAEASTASVEEQVAAAVEQTEQPVEEPAPPEKPPLPSVSEVALGEGRLWGEAHKIFWGTIEDPAPEHLDGVRPELEGRHYLRSDERNHHIIAPYIADVGGAYAGVGAEQGYFYAGWTRARLVWLTDYDPWIREVHRIYQAYFLVSRTPDEFMYRWEREAEDESLEILERFYGDTEHWELLQVVADPLRERALRRLSELRRHYERRDVATFVTDQAEYDYIRSMVKAERMRPVLANLLDDEAFRDIGRASRELGVPLRVLYLSNAEGYWDYTDDFRANMSGQYFDERSVILRTNPAYSSNGDYRYLMQPATNFVQWLAHPDVEDVRDMWDKPDVDGEGHIPLEILYAPPSHRSARGEPLDVIDPITPSPQIRD